MGYINALNLKSSGLNQQIAANLKTGGEVTIQNPHCIHNVAIGLSVGGKIIIRGSTGFYTGGFMEGPTVIVEGNAGWYAGDNMMDGELLIKKSAGCNAGTYLYGGTMVVYGNAGCRVGYGMKGGTIIVCGSAGGWAGQMTLGGKLVILGQVGKQIGESMFGGVILVRDQGARQKLGANVRLDSIQEAEAKELESVFQRYDIRANPEDFQAIRPRPAGEHTYVLFEPQLEPELSRRVDGENLRRETCDG